MRTMEFSFHKVANYAAFFVFLCSVLLISGTSTVQAENNAWVLDQVQYGTDPLYTEWVIEAWGYKTEYSVSIGEWAAQKVMLQLKSTTKHTQTLMDGTVKVWQDTEFIFDYYTPSEFLVPGEQHGYIVVGTSTGNPYGKHSKETFLAYADTWNNIGEKLQPLSNISLELNQENQAAHEIIAFKIPGVVDDQFIKIQVRLLMGAQFHVNFIYEPGTVTLEDPPFVLVNDGQGPVEHNKVPVAQGESQKVTGSNSVTLGKNARVTLNRDCYLGLLNLLAIRYYDELKGSQVPGFGSLVLLSILVLEEDPSICDQFKNKTAAKTTEANHLALELHSGAGRFESARSDLEVNIETRTATVNSVSQNDFAVGYNLNADVTIAACYKGNVTVDPANTALSGVTLGAGQQVEVTSNSIGPVTRISTASPAPFLLLLNDDGK